MSIESRLYGSIVRASSQHVRANCSSRREGRPSHLAISRERTSARFISFGLQEKDVSRIVEANLSQLFANVDAQFWLMQFDVASSIENVSNPMLR